MTRPFARRAPQPAPPVTAPAEHPAWLKRFDDAPLDEVQSLPRKLRRMVIADRRRRVTAALERFVAARKARS